MSCAPIRTHSLPCSNVCLLFAKTCRCRKWQVMRKGDRDTEQANSPGKTVTSLTGLIRLHHCCSVSISRSGGGSSIEQRLVNWPSDPHTRAVQLGKSTDAVSSICPRVSTASMNRIMLTKATVPIYVSESKDLMS